MKRYLIVLTALLLAAAPSQAQPKPNGKGGNKPASVVVAPVQKMPFSDSIEGLGTLRANESVTLTATVTKTITAVNFDDGQRVKAGTVLVEMNRNQEKAQLAQQRATLAETQRQLERIEPLVKEGAASASLLDQRQREYKTAQARLAEIQSLLRDYLIIAPFSGVIGLRNVSVGALVRPGDTVATLDDDSVMKLDFSVPSLYLSNIKTGLPIQGHAREFGDRVFEGKIESIDSRIDPVTRSFVVRAILPNRDHTLRPGLLMSVSLQANAREALLVPENSIVSEGYKNYVLTVDSTATPAVARKMEVTVGTRKPGQVEIVSGLSEGQQVITHGTLKAADGQPVFVLATQKDNEPLKEMLDQAKKDTDVQPAAGKKESKK